MTPKKENECESRSADGDAPHVASGLGPLEGLASSTTIREAELQAGPSAWEPQGDRTTSRDRVDKGSADADYEASMPGMVPDEARQKATGLHPNSPDAHVIAGSNPADSHHPDLVGLRGRLEALIQHWRTSQVKLRTKLDALGSAPPDLQLAQVIHHQLAELIDCADTVEAELIASRPGSPQEPSNK